MTIGEKIKALRKEKGLTQSTLASGIVTRNMLSLIESGSAKPSLSTTKEFAARLGVPVEYLISESDNVASFSKMDTIKNVRSLLKAGDYVRCLSEAESLGECDDETALIMMKCCLVLGTEAFKARKMTSSLDYFTRASEYAEKTAYATAEEIVRIRRGYLLSDAIVSKKTFYDAPRVSFGECDEPAAYIAALYDVDIGSFELLPEHKTHLAIMRLIKVGRYNEAKKAIFDQLKITNDKLTKYYLLRTLEDLFRKTGDFKGTFESAASRRSAYEELVQN